MKESNSNEIVNIEHFSDPRKHSANHVHYNGLCLKNREGDTCKLTVSGRSDPKDFPKEHVNHPAHYNSHPSGIECIDIIEHMPFNVGQVFKYLWRAGLKDSEPTDREYAKAQWYLDRERKRLDKMRVQQALRDAEKDREEAKNTKRLKPRKKLAARA